MVKKQTKRQRDIKSKLMAAICMLLVSSIMMVSSTYAWFTLSTAPEVTGITTSVGANGNLEMALQPLNGSSETGIGTAVGDSNQAWNVKNITWGNLVNLSSNEFYGLNNIMLYPSKLNTTTGADGALVIDSKMLATPEYGSDGRITSLVSKTITGVYDSSAKAFYESATISGSDGSTSTVANAKGVRAVGIASSMTERQLAYRSALSAANTATSQAKRLASQSLNNNGAALADIAIKHATATETETYSVDELKSLLTIVNDLLGYDTITGQDTENNDIVVHTTGSLEYITTALKQYALASGLATTSDDRYAALVDAVDAATLDTLESVMSTNGITNTVISDSTSTNDAIGILQATIANVQAAKSGLETLIGQNKASYAWNDFYSYLKLLADPDQMLINGILVTALKTGDNMSNLVNSVLSQGINLVLESGAGVYADIADFCGNYSANITIQQISYNSLTVNNLEANMATSTSLVKQGEDGSAAPGVYLTQASNAVPSYTDGGTTGSSSTPITDFYGYIIDLAFRTNAAGSNLQLQTEAVDRIYSDSANSATMGGGSSMTFAAGENFSGTAAQNLMECIRLVFFDTDSQKIVGYARLNSATASVDTTTGEITMDLVMTDEAGNAAADSTIMALEQNTVHELSVLVYLDGESITNADVANAAYSLTGSLNLQFSSSATLTPMDYSALKTESENNDSGNATTLSNVSATGYTVSDATYSSGAIGFKVADSNGEVTGDTVSAVRVSVDGDSNTYIASYQTVNGVGAWVVSYTGSVDMTTDPTITVTVTP